MSSEYMFGVTRGRLSAKTVKAANTIARRHGASFVQAKMPEGWQSWFAAPNRGEPFDRATSDAVWRDLEKAGLADAKGFVDSAFA